MKKKRKFLLFSFYTIFIFFFKIKVFNNLFANFNKRNQTGVLTHDIVLNHLISIDHPEKSERIIELIKLLEKKKLGTLIREINLETKEKDWVKTIHSNYHIKSLKSKYPIGEKSSLTAVKGCLQGIDEIMKNRHKNIFCAVRPPGHHALNTGKHEGFCFYNHVAISAKYIQNKYKLKKVLIIDWDYHHGNSTELFFYKDPSVLFFSTHDANAYPRTGSPERTGSGKGKGYNVNIHLPCGTTDKKIISTYENILVKKANIFKPDFILISAGFDSRKDDPLGCFDISDKGFKTLTTIALQIAEDHCNGRILSILEGGYNVVGNAKAAVTHIETLNKFYKNI